MMYLRRDNHVALCVLRVHTDVLDLPDVVVTDCNASRDYTRFKPALEGLAGIDRELVFAEQWTHSNPIEEYRRKGIKCAEVLVPDQVDPRFIMGAYVSCTQSQNELIAKLAFAKRGTIQVTVNGNLFFQ